LGIKDTVAVPDLLPGNYPFYLKAGKAQQATLTAYFDAKWGCDDPDNPTLAAYCIQIHKEIRGQSPFFYLKADGTPRVYSIFDGFTYALSGGVNTITPLVVDNDYPTGTFAYVAGPSGTLSVLTVQVKMKVVRVIP